MKVLGITCASVSYDDFYLTFKEQSEIANQNKDNKYWQGRGVAGSHDIDLGFFTIKNMKQCGKDECVFIPQYDKSLNNGKGDRADTSKFRKVDGPIDLVIVEGWMLGFKQASSHEQ